jgi:aspartate dehydrogenase
MAQVTQYVAGLIGCGFIGKTIASHLDEHFDDIQLRTIYDEYIETAKKLSGTLKHHPIVAENPDVIMDDRVIDLLIEAASTEAARKYVPNALRSGKNVLMMSVGALADAKLYNEVTSLAHSNNVKIYMPSGAIGGLDWVKAAANVGLSKVVITVRKPPRGLEGSPHVVKNKIDLSSIKDATQIYEGTASDAITAFPANVNVAIALALAGIGVTDTKVRVIADPLATRNSHEIIAEGEAGKMTMKVENLPAPTNPKTSWVAALSAIQKIKGLIEPISLGS